MPLGEYFWTIFEVDPETGKVLNRLKTPFSNEEYHEYYGLAYDGAAFWTNHQNDNIAFRLSPETGEVIGYFEYDFSDTGCPYGLAWEFPLE